MKRAYTDIPEGQMHYRHGGEGKNYAVFLHMSGSSSDEYEKVGDLLAKKNFNVYAIDLLAHGCSDRPLCFYSMNDHARSIISFMDSVNIDSAYLYGNLATANLAVHIGIDHEERVKGMMLAHPLYSPDPMCYAQKRDWPGFAAIEPQEDGSHLMEMWARAAKYGATATISDERCRCLHQAGAWGETLHWALFEDKPIGEYLPKLKVPTVIVAYSSFGEPDLLNKAVLMLQEGKSDIYENSNPYIARYAPERVVEMFIKYFPIQER